MKAHQRIIRENIEKDVKNNLFNKNLYPEKVSLDVSKIFEITFKEAKKIIMKYEWLMSMPHRFGYRISHGIFLNGILGGALVYAQPQVRSVGLFGEDYGTKSIIQLSRGACAFWTPKGTATKLISKSIKILKSEGITAVVAYCTPEAGEIGTIYQASNFIYYGKTNPSCEYRIDGRWIGERSYAHKLKWLKSLDGQKRNLYEKSFINIKKREVKPRYKYIKILKKSAFKRFKYDVLPYPKRNAEEVSREIHNTTSIKGEGQYLASAQI